MADTEEKIASRKQKNLVTLKWRMVVLAIIIIAFVASVYLLKWNWVNTIFPAIVLIYQTLIDSILRIYDVD